MKGDPLRHQSGAEGDVARQAVEPGDDNRAACLAGLCQRLGEARAPVEGVGTLAGLKLELLAMIAKYSLVTRQNE